MNPGEQEGNSQNRDRNKWFAISAAMVLIWIFSIVSASSTEGLIEGWVYVSGRGTKWFWFGWRYCSSSYWDAKALSEADCGEYLSGSGDFFGAQAILAIFYMIPGIVAGWKIAMKQSENIPMLKNVIIGICAINFIFSWSSSFAYIIVFSNDIEYSWTLEEWYPLFPLIAQWINGFIDIILITAVCCMP